MRGGYIKYSTTSARYAALVRAGSIEDFVSRSSLLCMDAALAIIHELSAGLDWQATFRHVGRADTCLAIIHCMPPMWFSRTTAFVMEEFTNQCCAHQATSRALVRLLHCYVQSAQISVDAQRRLFVSIANSPAHISIAVVWRAYALTENIQEDWFQDGWDIITVRKLIVAVDGVNASLRVIRLFLDVAAGIALIKFAHPWPTKARLYNLRHATVMDTRDALAAAPLCETATCANLWHTLTGEMACAIERALTDEERFDVFTHNHLAMAMANRFEKEEVILEPMSGAYAKDLWSPFRWPSLGRVHLRGHDFSGKVMFIRRFVTDVPANMLSMDKRWKRPSRDVLARATVIAYESVLDSIKAALGTDQEIANVIHPLLPRSTSRVITQYAHAIMRAAGISPSPLQSLDAVMVPSIAARPSFWLMDKEMKWASTAPAVVPVSSRDSPN